ncbi:MerR family transcriptional regulator [Rhodoblastus acidophilus]|uniref:MerR family transcriptional regulator n=1 Tax=Candidatus Rhodoblastus alkanivorans TaxID=2954117 RepID=A0ABS9Z6D5_9HYPH|nr:MerR family transcriptional regulator [Candidatus Rhodoblastus alkanivorans]MCI4679161.1 MerR family transcriptional regulator [Candidatus Rhodoblastus alkanivorans]MCI4683157.1 MerR family transcriptional regulator [Candidatus Rhodoblastus alkanivorans]MDI4640468.1 MerR family transcriptional regulator [Rhodoblastus acidophilus]
MDKTQDAFRTIGEVAEELDLPQHVLRFWETKFNQIRPVKRVGGRRYYRPEDVQLVAAIRILLYSEGYTIRGVQRILKEQGVRALIAASRANGRELPPAPTEDADGAAQDERAQPTEPAFEGAADAAAEGGTSLSPQDRCRLEAILVELDEGARILEEARRR